MAKLIANGSSQLLRQKCGKKPPTPNTTLERNACVRDASPTWFPVDFYLEEALGPVLHPHGRGQPRSPSASPPGHKEEAPWGAAAHRRLPPLGPPAELLPPALSLSLPTAG